MNKLKWICTAVLLFCSVLCMKAEVVRGRVSDAITGEPLIGAAVI